MPLTDAKCRSARAADKPMKLADSGGLVLFVTPAGSKTWRLRYRKAGAEQTLTLGSYPQMSLADARIARDEAKAEKRQGIDPAQARKARIVAAQTASANTFEAVARDWHSRNKLRWVERHASDVIESLEKWVFPTLGSIPINMISVPMTLACLREIEGKGERVETSGRVRQRMEAIFGYAVGAGLCENNPAMTVRKAMTPRKPVQKRPALVEIEAARGVLQACDATPAHPVTRLAMRLLALTALRPGALAGTTWEELNVIDLDAAMPVWRVPAARMKMKLAGKADAGNDFLLPLSRQAVEIIKALKPITGAGPYAFPNDRSAHKPMSENALGYLLNRAGFHGRHVPHGWRAVLSTWANTTFPADAAIIELMLAHQPENKVVAAYNRAQHMTRRHEIAQAYADALTDGLMLVEEIMKLRRKS